MICDRFSDLNCKSLIVLMNIYMIACHPWTICRYW